MNNVPRKPNYFFKKTWQNGVNYARNSSGGSVHKLESKTQQYCDIKSEGRWSFVHKPPRQEVPLANVGEEFLKAGQGG